MKAVTDTPLRLILTEPAFVALPLLTIISVTTKRIPAGTVYAFAVALLATLLQISTVLSADFRGAKRVETWAEAGGVTAATNIATIGRNVRVFMLPLQITRDSDSATRILPLFGADGRTL